MTLISEVKMNKSLLLGIVLFSTSFSVAASDGLVKYESHYSVKETADRFESIAKSKVWLSYNNPNYLMKRHDIKGCDEVINKISGVLSNLSKAAIAK